MDRGIKNIKASCFLIALTIVSQAISKIDLVSDFLTHINLIL